MDLNLTLDAILNFGFLIAWNLEQNGIYLKSKIRNKKTDSEISSRQEFFLGIPTGQ